MGAPERPPVSPRRSDRSEGGRERVVLPMMMPSSLRSRQTKTMSSRSSSVASGAILTTSGTGLADRVLNALEQARKFSVGGANKDESGTYGDTDGAEQPYVTYIEMLP